MKDTQKNTFDYDFSTTTKAGFGNKWNASTATPLFLADMDIPAPKCLQEAFIDHIQHHNFGYTLFSLDQNDPIRTLICKHLVECQNWSISPDEILFSPSHSMHTPILVDALVTKKETILTLTPEYNTFKNIINAQGREHIESRLTESRTDKILSYSHNLDDISSKLETGRVRMLLMSSPQNTTGGVFSNSQLQQLAHLCHKHRCTIVSSEVWAGLLLNNAPHQPISSISNEAKECTITLGGTSKTYGTSGLCFGYLIIQNKALRKKIQTAWQHVGYDKIASNNPFGRLSMLTLLEKGEPWRKRLLSHIRHNKKIVQNFLQKTPFFYTDPVSGYHIWLKDPRVHDLPLESRILEKSNLLLKAGELFDTQHGAAYARISYAISEKDLRKALLALKKLFP